MGLTQDPLLPSTAWPAAVDLVILTNSGAGDMERAAVAATVRAVEFVLGLVAARGGRVGLGQSVARPLLSPASSRTAKKAGLEVWIRRICRVSELARGDLLVRLGSMGNHGSEQSRNCAKVDD